MRRDRVDRASESGNRRLDGRKGRSVLLTGRERIVSVSNLPLENFMRISRMVVALAGAALCLTACDAPRTTAPGIAPTDHASFITHGTLDGSAHPGVVLIVMDIAGAPAFRCSGTLLSPRVVLTAGHCAGEPGEFSAMR